MQPLTCDGCHSSNDFANSVRTLNGGYKAGMGGYASAAKAFIQFPDVGESNMCIPCHSGRENGDSLKATISTTYVGPVSGGFKNPHYLAAAQTFYGVGGFQFIVARFRGVGALFGLPQGAAQGAPLRRKLFHPRLKLTMRPRINGAGSGSVAPAAD